MGIVDIINKIACKKVADTRIVGACTIEGLLTMDRDRNHETNVKEYLIYQGKNIANTRFRPDYTDEEFHAMLDKFLKDNPRTVTEVTK